MTITGVHTPTATVRASDGTGYAYRTTAEPRASDDGPLPLVLLQHFRGNLDNWDPALVDDLARSRPVITFDNKGVGGSTGTTPADVGSMARDALSFLDALGLDRVDVLGFSIGSFVAQELALVRPDLVRRLVLASSAPRGADGMHGWAPEVVAAVGVPRPAPDGYLDVFFGASDASRRAGREALARMQSRSQDRDVPTSWATATR